MSKAGEEENMTTLSEGKTTTPSLLPKEVPTNRKKKEGWEKKFSSPPSCLKQKKRGTNPLPIFGNKKKGVYEIYICSTDRKMRKWGVQKGGRGCATFQKEGLETTGGRSNYFCFFEGEVFRCPGGVIEEKSR